LRQEPAVIDPSLRQFFVNFGIGPCRLIAAVSGGTDSTALLLALAGLRPDGFEVIAAHINHHLRGADSDADEQFVRNLARELGVPFEVRDGALDPLQVRARGVEAAARAVRYRRLQEIRTATGAQWIATAHQKNDQAETLLVRLLTGGGLAALRGIHPLRDDGIVRPLLEVTRAEVEAYLHARGVVPRRDASNEDARFVRNRVRPFLVDAAVVESLAEVTRQARRFWPYVERAIDAAEREGVVASAAETRFTRWPDDPWLRGALLLRHIRRLDPDARDYDAGRIAAAVHTIRRRTVTGNLELIRSGDSLVLRRPPPPPTPFESELNGEGVLRIAALDVTLSVRRVNGTGPGPIASGRQRFMLPAGAPPHFTVRNRRAGDRFQPLGMRFPKKLKDVLIDRKIEAGVRDQLPLLLWNGEIVWIGGVAVSERFRVSAAHGDLYEVWLEGPGAADERDHAGLQR
jgi:tRNA(Ile)-lysidine synthase